MGTFEDDFAAFRAEYEKAEARLREIEGQIPDDVKAFAAECQAALDQLPDPWGTRISVPRQPRLAPSPTVRVSDLQQRLPAYVAAVRAMQSDSASNTNRTQRHKRRAFASEVNACIAKGQTLDQAIEAVLKLRRVRQRRNGRVKHKSWSKLTPNQRKAAIKAGKARYQRELRA